jgi:hypothetical protein
VIAVVVEMARVTHADPVNFDLARRRALWDWCEQAVVAARTQPS